MRSAAVSDRKAAHPFRRQETASEVRDRPKCCSPYQERRPMKPWQSQPGGQAVGKRPAEWALHGGFFSRPTHLGRRGQRPAGLSRLIRARKFPAPLRACGASRQRSYRGFLLNHPEISARRESGSAHTPVTHPTRALASPLEPTRPHSWAPTPPPPAGDCRKRNKQKEPPPARRLLPSRTRIRQRDG